MWSGRVGSEMRVRDSRNGSSQFKMAASYQANPSKRDGIGLAVAPLCHIAGMNFGVYMPVYARRTAVILARFDPETVIQAFEKYRCDMWERSLSLAHSQAYDEPHT